MITKESLNKALNFLNEAQRLITVDPIKFDPKKLSNELHVSNAKYYYAIKLGMFTRYRNPDGSIKDICNIGKFEPGHARMLLENEGAYRVNKQNNCANNKDLFINEYSNNNKLPKIPPTIEEVREYCALRKNNINPDKWYAHYESVGWRVGKNKMVDWKSAVHTWEQRGYPIIINGKKLNEYTDQELIEEMKRRGYSGLLEIKREIQF